MKFPFIISDDAINTSWLDFLGLVFLAVIIFSVLWGIYHLISAAVKRYRSRYQAPLNWGGNPIDLRVAELEAAIHEALVHSSNAGATRESVFRLLQSIFNQKAYRQIRHLPDSRQILDITLLLAEHYCSIHFSEPELALLWE